MVCRLVEGLDVIILIVLRRAFFQALSVKWVVQNLSCRRIAAIFME